MCVLRFLSFLSSLSKPLNIQEVNSATILNYKGHKRTCKSTPTHLHARSSLFGVSLARAFCLIRGLSLSSKYTQASSSCSWLPKRLFHLLWYVCVHRLDRPRLPVRRRCIAGWPSMWCGWRRGRRGRSEDGAGKTHGQRKRAAREQLLGKYHHYSPGPLGARPRA